MKLHSLTKAEEAIILHKGTEPAFSGKFDSYSKPGLYVCKRCGAALYRSEDKFRSGCGWPSFDDELPAAVKRVPDTDGIRIEIQCAHCGAHLGHVFSGEKLTKKNIRHCVNSVSLTFIPMKKVKTETIVLGCGCFWCTEAVFRLVGGTLSVTPGYAGGTIENPTYEKVCEGRTGHAEVVRIVYFPKIISLKHILDIFFAMHDPTSPNRQGNDIGTQYRSVILFTSKKQERLIVGYLKKLESDYEKPIVTEVNPLEKFYRAEEYHENYFDKNPHQPYCLLTLSPKVKKIKQKFGL